MERSKSGLMRALILLVIFSANYAVATGTPANPIYVDTYATAGNGSKTSPWTGWDTNTSNTWTPGAAYVFRQGWYAYASTPTQWSQSNMQLLGQPGTVLKCTACTGAVVSFVSLSGYPPGNIHFENFVLNGNGTASEGLLVKGISRSEFNNIRIRNVTTNGFHLYFNVLNTFTNPKVSDAGDVGTTGIVTGMPVTAMVIDGASSSNTIINPVFEGEEAGLSLTTKTLVGFKLAGTAIQNVIIGGTVEAMATGIAMCTDSGDVDCSKNTFIGIDLESNTANDIVLGVDNSQSNHAYSNQFSNIIATSFPATGKSVLITSSASSNQFVGGEYSSIYERGQYNTFINAGISGTDSAHLDAWFNNGAVLNMRNLSGGSNVTSRTPMNSKVGNYGDGLNNVYATKKVVSSSNFSAPTTIPISSTSNIYVYDVAVYVNSNITAAISAGATVSVGYVDGILPANTTLSGYVDPNNPGNVYIRWTVLGSSTLPATGNYKIAVMQ